MTLHGIICRKCKDVVVSRSTHDFRKCECGACYVDGGQVSYTRIGGDRADWAHVTVEVKDE